MERVVIPGGESLTIQDARKSLGYVESAKRTPKCHMAEMETRLIREVGCISEAMSSLDLTYHSLIRYAFRRSQMSGLHLGHLACHAHGFEKWADALLVKCLRRLLRLQAPVARCVLLKEHGIQMRFSHELLMEALMLWNRIRLYAKYGKAFQICCEAQQQHAGTWTSHVVKSMQAYGIVAVTPLYCKPESKYAKTPAAEVQEALRET